MKSIAFIISMLTISCLSYAQPLSQNEMDKRAANSISEFLRQHPSACFLGYEISGQTETTTTRGGTNLSSARTLQLLKKYHNNASKVMEVMAAELKDSQSQPAVTTTTSRTTATLLYSENKSTHEYKLFDLIQASDSGARSANKTAMMSKFSSSSCSASMSDAVKAISPVVKRILHASVAQ